MDQCPIRITENMTPKEKRCRKILTVHEKIQILDELKKPGFRPKDAVKKFGIPSSTIATLQKNETKLRCKLASSVVAPNSKRKRLMSGKQSALEEELYEWVVEKRKQNVAITGPLLMTKAKEIGGPSCQLGGGWLRGFKHRYNISFKKNRDDPSSSDREESARIPTEMEESSISAPESESATASTEPQLSVIQALALKQSMDNIDFFTGFLRSWDMIHRASKK